MSKNYKWHMYHSGYQTSHLGTNCAITGRPATIGKDYGLGNCIILTANVGRTITPADMCLVTIYYEDGMQKDMGCKAIVKSNDGTRLSIIGSKGTVEFTLIQN